MTVLPHSHFFNFFLISLTDKAHVAEWFFVERIYLSWYSQKNKGGIRAIQGAKYKKIYGGKNLLLHAHLWPESAQIEDSSQKMAQQVWKIKLDWKTLLLFKLFCYQVQSYCITDLWIRGTNFWDTLYSWKRIYENSKIN